MFKIAKLFKNNRGEMATALTILSFLMLSAGTILGSYFAQRETKTLSKASGEKVCSDNCKSNPDGSYKFCYNECVPGNPGKSRPVGCNSNGWVVGNEQNDPACGSSSNTCSEYSYCPSSSPPKKVYTKSNKYYLNGSCVGAEYNSFNEACAGSASSSTPIPNVSPTQNPSGGFHLTYSINPKNDRNLAEGCNVNMTFVSDGCDGDIRLDRNGQMIAGINGWNKGYGPFTYDERYTGSPYFAGTSLTFTGWIVRGPGNCGNQSSSVTFTIPSDCRTSGGGGGIPPTPTPTTIPIPTATFTPNLTLTPTSSILPSTYYSTDYQKVINGYISGNYTAVQISEWVSRATNTPGIKIKFCDPMKGECNIPF